MKIPFFLSALVLYNLPISASAQDIDILLRQADLVGSYGGFFSAFDLNSCTSDSLGPVPFAYSYTPSGDLYGLRSPTGKLYQIDEAQWTAEERLSIPTVSIWGEIAFTDDSTLYVIGAGGGPALAKVNINTAEVELFYELALSGFALTVRQGQLYAATGDGIVQINLDDPALSELVVPINPFDVIIEAMVTVPDGCGSMVTFAFGWRAFIDLATFLYIVDFDNQQLVEVCPLTFRTTSAASRHELGPPPCALALDPAAGAPGLSYAADTSCALLPLPLLADSFRLESEIGYLDSLRLRLSGALDGAAEYLSLAAADSLAVEGSGTGSLLLRPALGRPSLEAWRAALAAVRYHNEAQPLPQEGLREVAMQAFAAGNASDTAWALLPLSHTTPSAGQGGSIAFCPGDAPASLFAALGGSPAPGGAWQPGSGAFDPAADSPGEYLYIQAAGPGCPADTARLLVSLHAPPSFSLGPDTTLCLGQSLLLQAPDSLGTYLWSDGSSGPALLASQPGQYWLQAENSAGCGMAADTIELRYSDLAGAAILASPAACHGGSDGSLEAVPQGGLPPYEYAWSGGGGGNPLGGLPAGLYRLTLTDAAGCAAEAEAAVGQPAGPAIAEDSLQLCAGELFFWQGQPIAADTVLEAAYATPQGCDSLYRLRLSFADTVLVQEDAAICPGEAYSWEGLSLSRDTLLCLAFASAAGCDSLRCLRLAVRPGPALALPASVEFCPGASVELDAGPQAGYQWSTGEQGRRIAVSAPGTYSVTVADAEGCTAAAAVQASAAPPLLADAGPDAEIARGEAAILQGSTNASGASIQWLPPDHLSCDTCLAPEARPPQSQRYVLLVTDSLGCTASDEVFVAVARRAGFALPDAFSPNGDGRNDAFGPLPASVTGMRVLSFRVFGRWGGLVHERAALPLGDPALYWDGTWRGSPAPAGVYVYTLEVEWPDGTREQAAGEVLLLR
jgi:gliding motility-associated-like protein